ncbi:hypothetical protein [Nocardioides ferulae]|uniref:hypothetical protein n=1 Tax=Nocardioides ferulae TaxID=2340821 RepID=UPI000EAC4940|nr:hypothetical protein [Nocardioides ferulae]
MPLLVLATADLLSNLATGVAPLLLSFADQAPDDEDVKAGWTAFAIFLLGVAAVAFLGWSLTKQLKRAKAADEAGLFDPSDKPARRTTIPSAEQPTDPDR